MRKFYQIIFNLFLILLIAGCASQRYAKLALKNEQAGLYEDAAELYLKSLQAKKDNIDAKIGAKKNGQISLDAKLGKFSSAYSRGEVKNAVYLYLDAKTFYDKFSSNGISLEFPSFYEDQYNEVKRLHIEEKYKQGIKLLNEENFSESELIFKEILSLENTYKDVKDLWRTAHYEPLYRQGKNQYENKAYRKSYYIFNDIIKEIKDYKEAIQYKQDALTAALFPISINEFEYYSNPFFASKLKSSIINLLNNSGNPFIKIVDLTNRQEVINEQKLGQTGVINKNSSIQVGKLLGTKAFFKATVLNIKIVQGELVNNISKGYLKQVITTTNNGQTTSYDDYSKKIKYNEFRKRNYVNCIFKYQLISTETGVVLVNDEISLELNDEIHFARYDGDFKNVVPGYWKSELINTKEDRVITEPSEVSNFHKLFRARTDIKSTEQLTNELINDIAGRTSQKIINYNPKN